jgi:hypothetical protein
LHGVVAIYFLPCLDANRCHTGVMPVTTTLVHELRRLTAREKAVVADCLWREAELKLGPTTAQLTELDRRAELAIQHPHKLRPAGDAVRRLRR